MTPNSDRNTPEAAATRALDKIQNKFVLGEATVEEVDKAKQRLKKIRDSINKNP